MGTVPACRPPFTMTEMATTSDVPYFDVSDPGFSVSSRGGARGA